MCIGLNRRTVPTGGHTNTSSSNPELLNNLALKPGMVGLNSFLLNQQVESPDVSSSSSNNNKYHITVQHNYHDHASDAYFEASRLPARGGVVTPFPLKLHSMLEEVENDNLENIVSWQPHGRCFLVHDAKAFVEILIKYFKVSKVSSFQRQLNLYGFQRLTKGRDKGAYYHEFFLRGKSFLAHSIQRIKVKGTKIRARANPEQEPNFYLMPWVQQNSFQAYQKSLASLDLEPVPIAENNPKPMWDLQTAQLEPIPVSMWNEEEMILEDADAFFQDFDFPQDSKDLGDIEDDDVFGDLIEQMISS